MNIVRPLLLFFCLLGLSLVCSAALHPKQTVAAQPKNADRNYFLYELPAEFADALQGAEKDQANILTGNLSGVAVTGALGALSVVGQSKATAKLGDGVSLTVTPHSLYGASGAELNLTLNADETTDSSGGTAAGIVTEGSSTRWQILFNSYIPPNSSTGNSDSPAGESNAQFNDVEWKSVIERHYRIRPMSDAIKIRAHLTRDARH